MDKKRIEEIKTRCEATTPPPWEMREIEEDGVTRYEVFAPCPCCGVVATTVSEIGKPDAEFIAHSRQDVADLLTEIESLQKRCDALERAIKTSMGYQDACDKCVLFDNCYQYGKDILPKCSNYEYDPVESGWQFWQFDLERFSKEGNNDE